jgi:hypothetical protein
MAVAGRLRQQCARLPVDLPVDQHRRLRRAPLVRVLTKINASNTNRLSLAWPASRVCTSASEQPEVMPPLEPLQ